MTGIFKPSKWKSSLIVSIVAALAAISLACSSAQEPAAPEEPEPAAPAPAAPTTAPAQPSDPAQPAQPDPATTAAPAPAQPAPAPSNGAGPSGTVTAVVQTVDVGSGYPVDCLWCASITVVGVHESLFQAVRADSGALDITPGLVESWETSSDLMQTDMTIQEGVEFHKDFGPLTAEDVAWTFNALNTKITPEAAHDSGGEVIQLLDMVEAIDERTARFNWAQPLGGTTFVRLFADAGEGIGTFPKRAFDEMGGEWMRTNIVGTGPFQMDEWTQQKGIYVSAIPDHWRKTPYLERFVYLEVPEASTRRAMLETGEAQIGMIEVKDWPAMIGDEIVKASEGSALAYMFPFGGNYWENIDPSTGDAITRERDIVGRPWIGDPYEGGGTEFNPDTESMQRSLKVRQALMMAIDRETINEVLLSGLGEVSYVGGISVRDPAYDEKWNISYDPEGAQQLLAEAGYPDGGFTLHWWAGLNSADIEISEAIAADWLNLFNIQAEHDRRTYTTIRPSMVQREFPVLRMHSCCLTPVEWPDEYSFSALGINAYNYGIEVPKATENYNAKIEATDPDEVMRLSTELVDYLYEWRLIASIAELDIVPLYRANDIAEWQMRPSINNRLGGIRHPEWVRLAE